MFNILTLNEISTKGTSKLKPEDFIVTSNIPNPDAIMVRSADMLELELEENLLAISRAGAGTNNIPIEKCTQQGIVVFNTPGANANAVKELVLAGLLLSSRKIVEGINWTKKLKGENIPSIVEKEKKNFIGPELIGKTLGIVGLGAIGVLVANSALSLGLKVIGYDPYLSVRSALLMNNGINVTENLDEVLGSADYISIHVPYSQITKNMFDQSLISKIKKGSRLLNFSRGELVETDAILNALNTGAISKYITDFPCEELLNHENIICIPHLGASTPESEENCAEMAAVELAAFLKYGVIRNSVNFPTCESLYTNKPRITLIHKNIPKMVGQVTNILADENLNIDNMVNKSKGEIAYTLVDLDELHHTERIISLLEKIPGMIRVRLI